MPSSRKHPPVNHIHHLRKAVAAHQAIASNIAELSEQEHARRQADLERMMSAAPLKPVGQQHGA